MDGESILYIIIAIVYFVVSIRNSRKKAAEKKMGKGSPHPKMPEQQEANPKEPTLEELLGDLFGGQENKPEPVKQEVEPISNQEFQRQQFIAKQAQEAEARIAIRKQMAIEEQRKSMLVSLNARKVKKKSTKQPGMIYGNMSIREAIVAKAILDRPYL